MMTVPVNEPVIPAEAKRYVLNALETGWISSAGKYIQEFEEAFARYLGVKHAITATSGTTALHLSLDALGIGPGDEVIVPDFTMIASAYAVLYTGARPVLVDSDPDIYTIDTTQIAANITPHTKAIMPVHIYGHSADMDPIFSIAQERGIAVVEDAAEAHGARYKGRLCGSMGTVNAFSFYGNKIITTGEGGMAVTNDAKLDARMRFLKDHAMDPKRRYYHPEAGFNCRMTNIQAALGCAQLERIEELQAKKRTILEWYHEALQGITSVSLNPRMPWAEPVNWIVCAILDDGLAAKRSEILAELKVRGVDTRPFFLPVQDMPPYSECRIVGAVGDMAPATRYLSQAGFNLPSSPTLSEQHIRGIVEIMFDSIR